MKNHLANNRPAYQPAMLTSFIEPTEVKPLVVSSAARRGFIEVATHSPAAVLAARKHAANLRGTRF